MPSSTEAMSFAEHILNGVLLERYTLDGVQKAIDGLRVAAEQAGPCRECGAKQAQIDRLMLEYCPDEMTPEQVAEWAANQQPVSQEPVAWATIKNGIPNAWMFNPEFVKNNKDVSVALYATTVEQKNMKPVAWGYFDADGSFMDALDHQHGAYQTPLYAAPQPTQKVSESVTNQEVELTDDEILILNQSTPLRFARAVIAADRKKNGRQ